MNSKYLLGAGIVAMALGTSACSSSAHSARDGAGAPRGVATSVHGSNATTGTQQVPAIGSKDGFCQVAKSDAKLIDSLGGDLSQLDPSTYQREIDRVIGAAPDAIKADLQAIATVAVEIYKGNTDAEAKFESPALVKHVEHFASWMQTNCPGVVDAPTDLPTG